ncbi:hypothetical protein QBC46DRAFT_274597, partial [Diplogelasinospora grovesii]
LREQNNCILSAKEQLVIALRNSGKGREMEQAMAIQARICSLKSSMKMFSEFNETTLRSMNVLRTIHTLRGNFKAAESVYDRVLRNGRQRKLGESHPDTIISYLNLAVTYVRQQN